VSAPSIRIETDRLVLREHEEGDESAMLPLLTDPVAMRYLPEIHVADVDGVRDNLARAIADARAVKTASGFFLKVETRAGGLGSAEYVGEIGFTVIASAPEGRLVNPWYFFCRVGGVRDYARRRRAPLVDYGFEKLGIVKGRDGMPRPRTGVGASHSKGGFRKEGYFPLHVLHEASLRIRVEYGLTREDWARSR
jgi:RimJ/RimL family protein N-acetyltransferase